MWTQSIVRVVLVPDDARIRMVQKKEKHQLINNSQTGVKLFVLFWYFIGSFTTTSVFILY